MPASEISTDRGPARLASALVTRVGGRLLAYANVCRHVPLTLDLGDGEVAADDGEHFLCHHHGARYRVTDGVCVSGPGDGRALLPLGVEVSDGDLVIVLP